MRRPYDYPKHAPAYAHVMEKIGRGNEYDYTTNDYVVVSCPLCGIETQSFGATGTGWTSHKRAQAWADDHNKRFHAKELSCERGTKPPQVKLTFTCPHLYENGDDPELGELGAKSGSCEAQMYLIGEHTDELERPLYRCARGHYARVPRKVADKTLAIAVNETNAELAGIHRQDRLDRKIRKLEQERDTSEQPRMSAVTRAALESIRRRSNQAVE